MCDYTYELVCTCRYIGIRTLDSAGNEVRSTTLFKYTANYSIDYEKQLISVDGLDTHHQMSYFAIDMTKTYTGVVGGSGTITPFTDGCGVTFTPTQAEADIIFFVENCLEGCP